MPAATFVPLSTALGAPRQKDRGARPLVIYALADRRDMLVRYVGVTRAGNLDERLRRHLACPTNGAMGTWLASAQPVMSTLEYVSRAEWEDAERGWIFWFRSRGRLLNCDPGGIYRDGTGRPRGLILGKFQPPVSGNPSRARREDAERRAEIRRLIDKQRLERPSVFVRKRKSTTASGI